MSSCGRSRRRCRLESTFFTPAERRSSPRVTGGVVCGRVGDGGLDQRGSFRFTPTAASWGRCRCLLRARRKARQALGRLRARRARARRTSRRGGDVPGEDGIDMRRGEGRVQVRRARACAHECSAYVLMERDRPIIGLIHVGAAAGGGLPHRGGERARRDRDEGVRRREGGTRRGSSRRGRQRVHDGRSGHRRRQAERQLGSAKTTWRDVRREDDREVGVASLMTALRPTSRGARSSRKATNRAVGAMARTCGWS